MLTIQNKHTLINQRIVLSAPIPHLSRTYFVYNIWDGWGDTRYDIHIRHINKLHSDIELILLRVKTGEGYILCNKNKPSNSMLLSSEQIRSKQTFLKAIEVVMIMN
jgi:hypothetical protein